MECSKEKALKTLNALKELVEEDSLVIPTSASLVETMGFKPIPDLKQGDKLSYKGGGSYKYPQKGDNVCVYSTDVPQYNLDCKNAIKRDDFTFLIKYSDGDILEFSADSRYFERV